MEVYSKQVGPPMRCDPIGEPLVAVHGPLKTITIHKGVPWCLYVYLSSGVEQESHEASNLLFL